MKRHLTKSRIIGYLLLLTVMTLLVLSVTYSRYMTRIDGKGAATVAGWSSGSTINPVDIDVSGLTPGKTQTYTFQVTNTKDGQISDVAQDYSVTIETTNNLPLEFELSAKVNIQGGTYIKDTALDLSSGKAKADGGSLPPANAVAHEYTLIVSWPGNKTAAAYAGEIDLVTLTVIAEQVNVNAP